jgi:GNAT superfamily N-acetyltransferase
MLVTDYSQDTTKTQNVHTTFKINGGQIQLRFVRNSDVILIDEMHDRVSQDSLYYRYLTANKPNLVDLQHLCLSGGEAGKVIVAVTEYPECKIVAVAHYMINRDDPTLAEPAVLVEDSYQGLGLGKKIISILSHVAIQNDIRTFISYIHPVNRKVLQLIRSSGLTYKIKYNQGLKEVRVQLPSKTLTNSR